MLLVFQVLTPPGSGPGPRSTASHGARRQNQRIQHLQPGDWPTLEGLESKFRFPTGILALEQNALSICLLCLL